MQYDPNQYPPQQGGHHHQQYPPQQYPPQQYPPQAAAYPPQNMGAPGNLPEWKRIMQTDFFDISLPCLAGMCCPNIIQGIASYRVTNNICDFLVVFCCYPFVCCCYRSTIKKALLGPHQDSCCANLCSHLWCWCFAAGQEYRATGAWVNAGSPVNAVPGPTQMY